MITCVCTTKVSPTIGSCSITPSSLVLYQVGRGGGRPDASQDREKFHPGTRSVSGGGLIITGGAVGESGMGRGGEGRGGDGTGGEGRGGDRRGEEGRRMEEKREETK